MSCNIKSPAAVLTKEQTYTVGPGMIDNGQVSVDVEAYGNATKKVANGVYSCPVGAIFLGPSNNNYNYYCEPSDFCSSNTTQAACMKANPTCAWTSF